MVTGHVVTKPSATPHLALRLVTDVDLLLADTIASLRMNQRTIVLDPPSSLAACERCQVAYAQARETISQAGGITKWMEWICRPVVG